MKHLIYLKWVFLLSIIVVSGSLFAGPGLAENKIIIRDSLGREVVFAKRPRTVVSGAPSVSEIIFALGKEADLIGRTDYCDYPEDVKKIASIGGLQNPNIEKIIQLNPDVVIVSTHFKSEHIELLESLGIKLVAFYNDQSFEGVHEIIEKIAALFDLEAKGRELNESIRSDVAWVKDAMAKTRTRPKVYYVIGFGPSGDFTSGGNTFIHQLLEMAGGENIAAELKGWAFSFEKIVEADPDIIICSQFWGAKKDLEAAEGYRDLRAVKNGSVFEIDNNMLDRQGPRTAKGLMALVEIIHPELFLSETQ
ncbi:MAG: ABC transporter substrate-binding protein [Spirochaetales bacterium]|nr:ABC transporter substrate-binding protein [Spirochaetales bacterium]